MRKRRDYKIRVLSNCPCGQTRLRALNKTRNFIQLGAYKVKTATRFFHCLPIAVCRKLPLCFSYCITFTCVCQVRFFHPPRVSHALNKKKPKGIEPLGFLSVSRRHKGASLVLSSYIGTQLKKSLRPSAFFCPTSSASPAPRLLGFGYAKRK